MWFLLRTSSIKDGNGIGGAIEVARGETPTKCKIRFCESVEQEIVDQTGEKPENELDFDQVMKDYTEAGFEHFWIQIN